jgi:hypothetical protein
MSAPLVEIARGVRERDVGKRLREGSDEATSVGVVLLAEQTDIVLQVQESIKERGRFVTSPEEQIHVGEPEAAREKFSFAMWQSIAREVLRDESIMKELALDRGNRSDDARIMRWKKTDEGNHEQARVRPFGAVVLHEALELVVPTRSANLFVNLHAESAPSIDGTWKSRSLDRTHRAIERDPCHDLRVDEVLRRAAHLPKSVVGTSPCGFEKLDEIVLQSPARVFRRNSGAPAQIEGAHELAEDIELQRFGVVTRR